MSYYDNFFRPDNLLNPGVAWSDINSVGAGSGAIGTTVSNTYRTYGTGYAVSVVANAGFGSGTRDQFAQCTITTPLSEGGPFVLGSGTTAASGYLLLGRNDLLRIYRIAAGSFTQILDLSSSVAYGDIMKLAAEAGVLYAYKNGALLGSISDATFTTGYFGVIGIGNPSPGAGWSCTDFWGGVIGQRGDLWRRDGCNWH